MTTGRYIILLCYFATLAISVNHSKDPKSGNEDGPLNPKIAIVGGGIGGSAAAVFLRSIIGEKIDITLYEKEDHTCGRLGLLEVNGKYYNTGGCVVHPRNMHMQNLTKLAGFHHDEDGDGKMYFYDPASKTFPLKQTGFDILDTMLVLWRYGLGPLRLNWAVEAMLKDFDNIYKLQEQGRAFDTVEEMLHAMGGEEFVRMLKIPLRDYLEERALKDPLISEFAGVAMAVNYGQNIQDMQAFVGMVSMAGIQPGLWRIKEGNGAICDRLLSHAKADVRLSTPVTTITRIASPSTSAGEQPMMTKYSIKTGEREEEEEIYDGLIVAAPLQLAKIQLINFPSLEEQGDYDEGHYHRTVATFVTSNMVDPTFFQQHDGFDPKNPPDILAIKPGDQFSSIDTQDPASYPGSSSTTSSKEEEQEEEFHVHKVFSNMPLEDDTINRLFGKDHHGRQVHPVDWRAYPEYSGFENRRIRPLNIDTLPGGAAAYISPIEWAASAMEMSCIGANNAANIIAQSLQKMKHQEKQCEL